MNTEHSFARPTHEYKPTIIESGLLIRRLAIQLEFLKSELKRGWVDFKTDPAAFTKRSIQNLFVTLRKFASTPNALYACATAMMAITSLAIVAFIVQRTSFPVADEAENSNKPPVELVILNLAPPLPSPIAGRTGGNSLSPSQKPFKGISGGGDRNPLPPQFGKMPPPSVIPAAIPITAPVNPPALPVAGIDIDPALWKDIEARVYGDPDSKSQVPSSGPGNDGGIGTGSGGPGIGSGISGGGPGCGTPALLRKDGHNCTGPYVNSGPLKVSEVDQRPRLLFKPEPQYTEEARQNQLSGTVTLRVVFSSEGEVGQIRAVQTLPFGLTEKAIAAARQIKFIPAIKGGRPVSVHMQLEYNFNLY